MLNSGLNPLFPPSQSPSPANLNRFGALAVLPASEHFSDALFYFAHEADRSVAFDLFEGSKKGPGESTWENSAVQLAVTGREDVTLAKAWLSSLITNPDVEQQGALLQAFANWVEHRAGQTFYPDMEKLKKRLDLNPQRLSLLS
ncbi:MAG: hypothetical protein SFZ03_08415 [Candidatus Melainabacteria bacterium]|nr:hypothetical protein [Candidatus Melainabacteria bacterium]